MSEKELVDEAGLSSLDPKHAPVSVPAGSYDVDALAKGLDTAAEEDAEKQDAARQKALEGALGEGTVLGGADGAAQPDDIIVQAKHPVLGIEENLRVYHPPDEEDDGTASTKKRRRQTAPAPEQE